jgi:hypothetical protein
MHFDGKPAQIKLNKYPNRPPVTNLRLRAEHDPCRPISLQAAVP